MRIMVETYEKAFESPPSELHLMAWQDTQVSHVILLAVWDSRIPSKQLKTVQKAMKRPCETSRTLPMRCFER